MGALTGPEHGLAGTAAVVNGGAGLIGAGIATVLARYGARMVIVDTDAGRARTVVSHIESNDGVALALEADVGDEADVANAFDAVDRLDVPLRVLVNCAAPVTLALQELPAAELAVPVWDEMIRIVLRGTMLCCRAALQRMVDNGCGAIVNISSVHAHAGICLRSLRAATCNAAAERVAGGLRATASRGGMPSAITAALIHPSNRLAPLTLPCRARRADRGARPGHQQTGLSLRPTPRVKALRI
jgi:NAD(P)-dependent dehydrogenase (short-subunit alcohol dehydrogenase family)